MKVTKVYDGLIAAMMKDEHHYLFRGDGEPYRFIGEDVADRTMHWDKLLKTEIPVNLTVREAFIISRLLQDCGGYTELFGIEDTADKLAKAVFDKTK